MARSHGILKTEVWDAGSDFRQLTIAAQWAYVMLLSQPQISNCGVLVYLPERWARLADGLDPEQLHQALAELRRSLYIVVDEAEGELLVRTFIKHDRIGRQPQLVNAARREYREIESTLIRQILAHQHPWLADDRPHDAVREHEDARRSEPLPEALLQPLREALPAPLPEPLWQPLDRPLNARATRTTPPLPQPHPLPRDGASGVHAAAADSAQRATSAADTNEHRPNPDGLEPDRRPAHNREPAEAQGKKPWNRHAAEAWIRNVGWLDPHPEHHLDNTYDHVPAADLHELVELAHTLAATEAGEALEPEGVSS